MTTPLSPSDISTMAQINANHPRYIAYLQAQRAEAVSFMVGAADLATIHRSQGRVSFLDEQINLLASAHKLLHPSN